MDSDKLRDWVRGKHAGQLIRCSGEPYFEHVLAVAEMAAPYAIMAYEVGLCHDLIEKTTVRLEQLSATLIQLGISIIDAKEIVGQVMELTNVYTKVNFPLLKKTERKRKEAKRLVDISPGAQTVKYADLLYNLHWMQIYDRDHLRAYVAGKKELLKIMNKGNPVLWKKVINEFDEYY